LTQKPKKKIETKTFALPYIAEGDVRRGNRLPLLTSPSAMYGNALPDIAEGDVRRFCLGWFFTKKT